MDLEIRRTFEACTTGERVQAEFASFEGLGGILPVQEVIDILSHLGLSVQFCEGDCFVSVGGYGVTYKDGKWSANCTFMDVTTAQFGWVVQVVREKINLDPIFQRVREKMKARYGG
jgi:hypothetical protein